jgi:RNA ligase (TIGR02306 family)
MSTFSVPIVCIGHFEKHPNADTLSITEVEGCPVIFRTGELETGSYAVYVPVDAVVPTDKPAFAFLATKEGQATARIKAKKLRGVFSMGLLLPARTVLPGDFKMEIGGGVHQDVAETLGIVKYEEPEEPNMKLGAAKRERQVDSSTAPIYDIESHRKYKSLYAEGEEVVVTEKIHGCNGRFVFRKGEEDTEPRLYVGSRNFFIKDTESAVWWKVARQYDLATKLAGHEDLVLYGEVYGQVQDLKYGTSGEDPLRFAAFDIYDKKLGRFWDYRAFLKFCEEKGIPTAPILYFGPYNEAEIEELSKGQSVLANQIKEGVVIKPATERWDYTLGRVITKLVGEQYLLRKNGTEHH